MHRVAKALSRQLYQILSSAIETEGNVKVDQVWMWLHIAHALVKEAIRQSAGAEGQQHPSSLNLTAAITEQVRDTQQRNF